MNRNFFSNFVNILQIDNDYHYRFLNNIILYFSIVNSYFDCKLKRKKVYFNENDNHLRGWSRSEHK